MFQKVAPAARWDGGPKVEVMHQKVVPEWVGVPKVGVVFQTVVPEWVVFQSWGGVPKSCPRIPTAGWGGVPKVGVVFQKVVPESPLCILLAF